MAKHEAAPLNDGFDFPLEVTDLQMTFPAELGNLLPKWEIIPEEFKSSNNLYTSFADAWFFEGWPANKFLVYPKGDIDPEKATRHLYSILRSYAPQHQHKIAAVAWLAYRWLDIERNTK